MTDPFVILFLIITPVMMIGLAVRQAQIQKLLKNLLPSKWEGYGVWGDWIDAERQSHDCRIQGLSRKIDEKEKLDLIVLEQQNKNHAALKDQLAREIENGCAHDAVITELEEQIIPELRSQLAAQEETIRKSWNTAMGSHIKYTDEKLNNIRNEHSALSEQLNNQEKLFITQSAHEGLLRMLKEQSGKLAKLENDVFALTVKPKAKLSEKAQRGKVLLEILNAKPRKKVRK